ncbi:M28 family peptidase [Clostridium lundense]|uniref:M28 family peptidase n=1 Tax=Clostridium lundense TaxID=319475 RepID=UPI00048A056F|nr:M28 family peptidase [Clostridium lundense]
MFKEFYQSIDSSYTEEVIDKLSSFGDDPATGNRSAGSKACTMAAKYLYNKFEGIGLTNVHLDDFIVNGWTFNGANLKYIDNLGKANKIVLGGYATNFVVNNKEFKIVDGGKGTLKELESLGDINGKLVLISTLNTYYDYWVNFPSYQAYLKGAAGVIVAATHNIPFDDILISNDILVPSYCKTLSISIGDANKLKSLIKASVDNEISVTLNAESKVLPYQTSYNVWGEIKGKTDEVIYLMAHYDGYYHSYFDDASGVSEILGIAKALINSFYDNKKTIRIIAHGAEEWGKGYTPFDWAAGAYEQIMHIHPEWPEKAFALINIDGNFPITNERNYIIYTSPELFNFVKNNTSNMLSEIPNYNFNIKYPVPLPYEDFIYQKSGIPAITAGDDFENSLYYKAYYHSSADSKGAGFDIETHKLIQCLYGSILIYLDNLSIRPMDFHTRFVDLKNSFDLTHVDNNLIHLINRLCFYSKQLTYKIKNINSNNYTYSDFNYELNQKLYKLYKIIQDNFLAFNYSLEIVFPHSVSQNNLSLLSNAINALKNKTESLEDIVNNYILEIDLNYLVFDYDKTVYNFMANRYSYGSENTFGEKMYLNPNEDLYDVAHSLKSKYNEVSPNVNKEIDMLTTAYNNQTEYYKKTLNKEFEAGCKILKYIKYILEDITLLH